MELAEDLLSGVKAIAEYRGEPERRTYHLLETGQIPGYKLGGRWNSRKSTQLAHIEKLESGEAA
jgi:hypothetical protein